MLLDDSYRRAAHFVLLLLDRLQEGAWWVQNLLLLGKGREKADVRAALPKVGRLDPRTGFPLNCRTPPLLGAKEYSPRVGSALWVSPSCGTPPLLGANGGDG